MKTHCIINHWMRATNQILNFWVTYNIPYTRGIEKVALAFTPRAGNWGSTEISKRVIYIVQMYQTIWSIGPVEYAFHVHDMARKSDHSFAYNLYSLNPLLFELVTCLYSALILFWLKVYRRTVYRTQQPPARCYMDLIWHPYSEYLLRLYVL